MFLDEKLLELCKNTNFEVEGSVAILYENLHRMCEDYYKSKLKLNMSNKEVKTILDRTFNLWDSFIRLALREKGFVKILGESLQNHSFKDSFMNNDKLREVYEKL